MSFNIGTPVNRKKEPDIVNDVKGFYEKTMNTPYPPWSHKPWDQLPQQSKDYWAERYKLSRNG